MGSRMANTENDADDSDSLSDSGYVPHRIPRRSATVSPAARTRFGHHSNSRSAYLGVLKYSHYKAFIAR
uniref:Movement protein n=1 Tax=Ascaris lumbricoides TaxID=6252 RepID=A0A0M3IR95_ASCLU